MSKIAFMGLGKMGSGMARCLVSAGHEVSVWNRTAEKTAPVVAEGARAADSPADAADGADAILSMVADDQASWRVWRSDDGALATARSGALAIECSTISHGHVRRLSQHAAERGLAYVDCPVNGPPGAAAAGELILLVGASDEDLTQARPLLEVLASSILHFGAVGTGTAFKLINNLLGAVHAASLAEAVALASRLDLDRETFVAAVQTGPCASPHVKRLVAPMVEDRVPDSPGLSVGLREKDTRYCMAMAKDLAQNLAIGDVAHRWYAEAAASHWDEDDSALVKTVATHGGRI